jgi:type IV pilus assembly protein PilA
MKNFQALRSRQTGFTLIELMAVIAIIAILAMMTIPSYYYRLVREQIESISPLTAVAEAPVAAAWTLTQTMPADNAAAGLPSADKMVDNYVSAVQIQNGAVNVTFGNHAMQSIKGKILTYRPAVVLDSPIVPVTWVCGNAAAPNKMTVLGVNQTNIPPALLPLTCK